MMVKNAVGKKEKPGTFQAKKAFVKMCTGEREYATQ